MSPFLIRFPENPIGLDGIRYYGLAYVLGFVGAYYFLRLANKRGRSPIDDNAIMTLMTALAVGVIVGGRMGYFILYEFSEFVANPLGILRIWEGGMASHGGFIGVALAMLWFARSQKMPLFQLSDLVVAIAPLGLMLGRIANFINGELWGRVSDVWWAVIFPNAPQEWDAASGLMTIPARHPSQLYQAFLEGFCLLALVQLRFWYSRPSIGKITGEFLAAYGVLRIVGEFFREPDASLIVGMSRGQFYSIALIVLGIGIWVWSHRRRGHVQPS